MLLELPPSNERLLPTLYLRLTYVQKENTHDLMQAKGSEITQEPKVITVKFVILLHSATTQITEGASKGYGS